MIDQQNNACNPLNDNFLASHEPCNHVHMISTSSWEMNNINGSRNCRSCSVCYSEYQWYDTGEYLSIFKSIKQCSAAHLLYSKLTQWTCKMFESTIQGKEFPLVQEGITVSPWKNSCNCSHPLHWDLLSPAQDQWNYLEWSFTRLNKMRKIASSEVQDVPILPWNIKHQAVYMSNL